jgi:signal transduction histidine kinase
MTPAAGVPLHFSVEALGLGVAGVTAAWAALGRRALAAAGALLVVGAQVVYAGQFAGTTGPGALAAGVTRIAGLALIVAGAWVEGPVIASVAALVAGATVWRMAVEAGPASMPVALRAIEAAGFVAWAVWAWRRAAATVRARIVAAFVAALAAAVVVMGGAAARVGVTNATDTARARLGDAVRAERALLTDRALDLLNRAALGSAVLSQLGPGAATLASLHSQAFSDADVVGFVAPGPRAGTGATPELAASAPARAALAGRGATGYLAAGESVLAAQPVFGRTHTVAGALVVGQRVSLAQLGADARAAVRGARASIRTLDVPARTTVAGAQIIATAPVNLTEPPPVALEVSASLGSAAEVATTFPRALVGGVLVAALLAVVLALWLASRITRPILSLADEAERVKTDFLATVSHELRTPLTPIRGYADLLRRGRVPRRRAELYLDEIDEAARRMERIVGLLVEVAAMEAGRFAPEMKPVSPSELLAAAAERHRGLSRRYRLSVRVPKSLPRVAADARSLTAALGELVDNAVKFSPGGGTIELRARRVPGAVEIAVADEGIGLDADELARFSAAFVQAEPGTTRRFGGLGLGLTFAAGVLAAHGSHLVVEGTKDAGATFSFTLPAIGMVTRMSGASNKRDDVTT